MNTSAVSPGRAGLLLLLSGQMLPLIDTSITNVALDAITHARPGETADVFMGFSIASFSRPT